MHAIKGSWQVYLFLEAQPFLFHRDKLIQLSNVPEHRHKY